MVTFVKNPRQKFDMRGKRKHTDQAQKKPDQTLQVAQFIKFYSENKDSDENEQLAT